MLIDIGANLTHRSFAGDRAEVLERAVRAGVERIIVTGTSESTSVAAEALAATLPQTLCSTAGIHPHNARELTDQSIDALRALAERDCVVAVGECGLDYDRDFSPRPIQRRCFEAQLQLACELAMPVFLHERQAHDDFVSILRQYRADLVNGVVHCFTGNRSSLEAYLAMDMHIGLTGFVCDERRGAHLLDLAPDIGPDRLMIETDAPFLLPRNMTPKPKRRRNEPSFLPYVLRAIANAKGVSEAELAEQTAQTARRFFRLGPSPDS